MGMALLAMTGCTDNTAGVDDTAAPQAGAVALDGLGLLGWSDAGNIYLCGVDDHVADSRWFREADGGDWESLDGTWSLQRDGDDIALTSPTDAWSGTLQTDTESGVYDAWPQDCRSGAVVLDGQLAGTWCDGLGVFRQVEPIDTIIGSPQTLEVALADDPATTFTFEKLP